MVATVICAALSKQRQNGANGANAAWNLASDDDEAEVEEVDVEELSDVGVQSIFIDSQVQKGLTS